MRIRNVDGTGDHDCACGSWIEHWRKFSRQSVPAYCPVNGCMSTDVLGAHVKIEGSSRQEWFIYPLCREHNARADAALDVSDSYLLVSANVGDTCGRSATARR
ncbi:MAG: hypothetical protein HY079_09215 [Elusimicrobia bacterium]|nr:hypothetical protein [Elusimicrobiota bacterium]